MFYWRKFPRSGRLMFETMRQLHPRGAANRGICVDRDGAVLGPECILVGRTPAGFRSIDRNAASAVQKCALDGDRDADWLFRQSQRIADALNKGEVALAQIYGLRIPVGHLDDRLLKPLAAKDFAKWNFNPDEPRIPKGDPHGGEWTTGTDSGIGAQLASPPGASADSDNADGGGSGVLPILQLDTVSADDSSTATDDGNGSDVSSGGSTMRYEWVPSQGGNSDGGSPTTLPSPDIGPRFPPPIAAFAGNRADWLFGDLAPETAGALARFMTGMTGASIVFGILFIPTDRSIVGEGPIAGSPGLSYRYDSEMGTLQIRQDVGSLGSVLLTEAHIGTDGLYRDAQGNIVGRYLLGSGVVIDVGALPGYRMVPGINATPNADTRIDNQPKLCPDPSPDRPGAPLDNPYQQYVSMLVNGRALPPGLAVSLFNPISGNNVVFDDCRLSDGTMIEAKGDGYLEMLMKGTDNMPWLSVQDKLVNQADAQLQAAQGRPVEWYFKAGPVADYVRELFNRMGIRITVIHAPQPE